MAKDLLDPIHEGPGQSRVQAALFVGFLALGGIAALSTPAARSSPQDADVLRGEWTARWEKSFDAALPWRDASIATWGVIEWFGFGTARTGALVGDEGWMFTSEEFETRPQEAEELALKLDFIERAAAALKGRGADLVIAVVPAKARVCSDKLGRYTLHDPERYDRFVDELRGRGIPAPDLSAALSDLGCEASFLRTDTHWTPAGARGAALAIAEAVKTPLPTAAFATERGEAASREGDLLAYLPLGALQASGPQPDLVTPERTSRTDGGAGDLAAALLGDVAGPAVALVGTSYSFNPDWNFSGALKEALKTDVLNVAEEGGGPFKPMATYLGGPEIEETPPRLVLWEIPERYLTVSYDLTLPEA